MRKLDELMALAETMKDRAGELDYEDGSPSEYYKARAALQDALKAVVEDAERYRWLRDNAKESPLRPQAYNADMHPDTRLKHAMPELVSYDCIGQQISLDAAIDAARKP